MIKRILYAVISLVLLASCSTKKQSEEVALTNEEKAIELIEKEVKANMLDPESYEFAKIQLDSCYLNSYDLNPEAIGFLIEVSKLFKEYNRHKSEAENAQISMAMYAPSYGYQDEFEKQKEKKYRNEMERAQRKANAAKEQILQLYKDNKQMILDFESDKHDFIGWRAVFFYRSETFAELESTSYAFYFLNKDLTKITHHFTIADMLEIENSGLDDLKYEFEEELKEIFGDEEAN